MNPKARGTMRSTRTCTNPGPKHGGKDCVGDAEKGEEACDLEMCERTLKMILQNVINVMNIRA